ncbi:hypothetical protein [Dinoroseobacter shibae]|jgi:hypothetical protein|uniref:hypothetical protein n=1 Tax=Dinoroseobacter shibae TaxID=215813 RepID=UPI0005C65586|nr:hypothetical protein [Dinoroseobacter shibae]URF46264.1 hypothetical protein M8008_16010 [Dinoroseobacter shibae]URF50571.1 hypothetical protein M8007_16010 [Dinoroseobacter shibae]
MTAGVRREVILAVADFDAGAIAALFHVAFAPIVCFSFLSVDVAKSPPFPYGDTPSGRKLHQMMDFQFFSKGAVRLV